MDEVIPQRPKQPCSLTEAEILELNPNARYLIVVKCNNPERGAELKQELDKIGVQVVVVSGAADVEVYELKAA